MYLLQGSFIETPVWQAPTVSIKLMARKPAAWHVRCQLIMSVLVLACLLACLLTYQAL